MRATVALRAAPSGFAPSPSDFGRAEREREKQVEHNRVLQTELEHLQITSPIAGVVITPRLRDLVGSYLQPGTQVAEVADMRTMRARIYIPEFGVRDVGVAGLVPMLLSEERDKILPILDRRAELTRRTSR